MHGKCLIYGFLTSAWQKSGMYEGAILGSKLASDTSAAPGEEGVRALSWGELVARLGASQEFRRLMTRCQEDRAGSFDAGSARHIAALGDGKPAVNPNALTNGKIAWRIAWDSAGMGLSGGRGT